MSLASLSHVWNVSDLTCEEKLVLLWIANSDGGLGYPVCVEWIGMGEFIGEHFAEAVRVATRLEEKGLIHWGRVEDEQSHWVWIAYDGPYREPPYFGEQEPKKRSKRVLALLDRDGPGCKYCGKTPVDYHLDHVIPRSRGGPDDLDNLVLACAPCNMEKGARTPEEWQN